MAARSRAFVVWEAYALDAALYEQRLLSLHLAMRRTALADAWARWRSTARKRSVRFSCTGVSIVAARVSSRSRRP